MKRGYIVLWRCIRDNHFWQDKPFDRCRAWIDLLMMANHTDGIIRSRGISTIVLRGQVGTSELTMSNVWGWSRGKVRRFLKDLREQGQIVQQNNNVTSLITIVNYNEYQFDGTASSTTDGTADGHQTVQQTDTKQYPKKELNNGKNANNRSKPLSEYSDDFISFWSAYPDKTGKGKAYESWRKMTPPLDAVLSALEWQRVSQKWIEGYIPNPATYLNQRRWEDSPPERRAAPRGPVTFQEQASINRKQAMVNFVMEGEPDGIIEGKQNQICHALR